MGFFFYLFVVVVIGEGVGGDVVLGCYEIECGVLDCLCLCREVGGGGGVGVFMLCWGWEFFLEVVFEC